MYNLEFGNYIKAVENVRKKLPARKAFREWLLTKEDENIKILVLKAELRLVRTQTRNSIAQNAAPEQKALHERLNSRKQELEASLTELGFNANNVVDDFEVFKKDFPGTTDSDFTEYEQEKEGRW